MPFLSPPADHHLVFVLLGKAPREDDKFYRWRQWQHVVDALDPMLAPYPFARVESRQAHCIVLGTTPQGIKNVTYKKAPTGGVRKWSRAANEDLATRHLGKSGSDVVLQSTQAWAGSTNAPANGWDVYVDAHDVTTAPDAVFNQAMHLSFSTEARARLGETSIETALRTLGRLLHAVKMGVTHRPWSHTSIGPGGARTLDVLIGRRFDVYGTTELRENPWAAWADL